MYGIKFDGQKFRTNNPSDRQNLINLINEYLERLERSGIQGNQNTNTETQPIDTNEI